MNTATRQYSYHVSVPPDEGVRVDKVIAINRPVADVYSFWRRFENFPRFMRHIQSVTVKDALHSRWAVKTVAGKVMEWDAEIIEERANEMISWRSAPGADVNNAGSVWFRELPGGHATVVRVQLKYLPAAGKTGVLIAKLFGRDADAEIDEDLYRLKSLLETGHVPDAKAPGWQRTAEVARDIGKTVDTFVRDHYLAILIGGFALGFALGWGIRPRRTLSANHDLCPCE